MEFRRFILVIFHTVLLIGLTNFSYANEIDNQGESEIENKNLNKVPVLSQIIGKGVNIGVQNTKQAAPKIKMTLKEKRQLKRQKNQELKVTKKQYKVKNPIKRPALSPLSKPFKRFEALNHRNYLQSVNYTISNIDEYWTEWKLQYGKSYENATLDNMKKEIFATKLKDILSHNRDYHGNNALFKRTIYGFGDTTPDEFIRLRTGFTIEKPVKNKKTPKLALKSKIAKKSTKILLTANSGLNLTNYVTNVKDQANCGCCWAAASALAIETQLNRLGKSKILSLQQIVDCADSPSLQGCNGGLPHIFYELLSQNQQIVSPIDKYEPFTATQNTCKNIFEASDTSDWKLTGFHYKYKGTELDLKDAVDTYGACVIGIHAAPDLALYKEGIYTSKKCDENSNHAVVVLGYGKDKKTKKDYWIIQNSWGSLWGEQGTFRMLLGKNMCRVADYIACPIME